VSSDCVLVGGRGTVVGEVVDDVRVDAQRHGRVAVTEPAGNVMDRGASLEQDRCVMVAEIVNPHARHTRRCPGGLQHTRPEIGTVEAGSAHRREQPALLDTEPGDMLTGSLEHRPGQRDLPTHLELESHSDLLRLKLAALLASLEGRHLEINASDWHLSGVLLRRSNQIRDAAIGEIHRREAAKNRKRQEQRGTNELELEELKIQNATKRGAQAIARKVWRSDGPLTRRDIQLACSGEHRKLSSVDAMCEHAVRQEWIVDTEEGWVGGKRSPLEATP
jgi:hypothetical protein